VAAYLAFATMSKDAAMQRGILDLVLALAPSIPPDSVANNVMNAPVALLYYVPLEVTGQPSSPPPPTISHFRGAELVTARSSDPTAAAFIGFKGRRTEHGLWAHTHLDGGTFVFQFKEQWWVQDLGSDQYSAPDYFGKNRFHLYRTGSLGHNTLTFQGANQFCEVQETYSCNCSQVPMSVFNTTDIASSSLNVSAFAIVDFTEAYARAGLVRAQRGFIVSDSVQQLLIVDEITGTAELPPVWWSLHTVADVQISETGLAAALTMKNMSDTTVSVRLLPSSTSCPGAKFSVTPVDLQPPLLPSPGISRLTLSAPAATCTRLVVAVGVLADGLDVSVRPLREWEAAGPL
jgi:Heparinase II/III-like protein